MNVQKFIFFTAVSFLLGSCVLNEARPDRRQEVFLFTDELTDTDSLIIQEFEKKTKCNVRIRFIEPEKYFEQAKSDRYNTGADILWFSNDSIREKLHENGLLAPIQSKKWKDLESEFSTKHKLWFPVCHDPLVLTKPKDTINDCKTINFNTWHKKDSLSPKFYNQKLLKRYYFAISRNELKDVLLGSKYRKVSNETLWSISTLAKKQTEFDSTFRAERYYCKHLISYRKKHISQKSCLFIAKYSRNGSNAKFLVSWIIDRHKNVAAARNQLSCIKNTEPNYIIRNMSLNY